MNFEITPFLKDDWCDLSHFSPVIDLIRLASTIQIYNLLLFYNYRLCRSWSARNCLAELHHAETLSDFRLTYVGVVSHGDACVSHARPTNHVFTFARKPIASMVASLTCQVFKRYFWYRQASIKSDVFLFRSCDRMLRLAVAMIPMFAEMIFRSRSNLSKELDDSSRSSPWR